ncbi:MAG: thiamine-phosphate kinase [Gemmatimonadales bacterium]
MSEFGPGREFDLIRKFEQRLGGAIDGIGHDCAILPVRDASIAVSSDLSIEGTHFRFGWLEPHEVGWRATAAALSDLAAAGARPAAVLVSLGFDPEWPDERAVELMDGCGAAAGSVGARIVGGDVVKAQRCTIGVTVLGTLDGPAVNRSGASIGDRVWVTGSLGGPAQALLAWQNGAEPDAAARTRFAHPIPRIEMGLTLRGVASAMIDLSDGLASDAGHLAAASGVGLTIDYDAVPLHPSVTDRDLAFTGGEEYELLFTVPHTADVPADVVESEVGATHIGEVVEGSRVVVLRGDEVVDVGRGYRHL